MKSRLTVIMYHYVRNIAISQYPRIKGLEITAFVEQLKYIRRFYNVVSLQEVIGHFHDGATLPPKALMLTFDDGYADHFRYVFPILSELNLPASFYVPANAIRNKLVLNVNKIHLILASCSDERALFNTVLDKIASFRDEYELPHADSLIQSGACRGNRYDSKEVVFVKQALQVLLPEVVRQQILDEILPMYTDKSELELSEELYLSKEQILEMQSFGMDFGAHGDKHVWLNSLNREEKRLELCRSREFLEWLHVPSYAWAICYPYGGYDSEVLTLAAGEGFRLGLTTEVRVADTMHDSPLAVPRLDTNDIPRVSVTQPNCWYYQG